MFDKGKMDFMKKKIQNSKFFKVDDIPELSFLLLVGEYEIYYSVGNNTMPDRTTG